MLEEQYVDIGSIFTKQSDDFFCFKGVCVASLRKQNRIIFVALTKADGSVAYAYCQCPAERVGTCSHIFAVMKLVAKWVIDKINKIPKPKACTSKPCAWSIPKSRERLEKSPIPSLKIFSPTTTKSKINTYSKGSTINNTSSTNTLLLVPVLLVLPVVIKASHHLFMMLGLTRTKKMVNVNYRKCMMLFMAITKIFQCCQ